jgi:ABC-type Fe3+ transport system permease subunit
MLTRTAFLTQGRSTLEAAQILGYGPPGVFRYLALPMARPGIVAGTSLALMETLADFGTVATFNYDTFTTAIYKAWFGFFSLQAASQLASLLLPRPLSWATGLVSCMKATCCSGTRPLIFTTNRMIVLLPILSARAAFFVGNSLLLMP